MEDGEVLMSSPYVGYQANVNKDLTVMTEDHVKARNTDYCGYAIADGGVTSTKAHALLKYTVTEAASDNRSRNCRRGNNKPGSSGGKYC